MVSSTEPLEGDEMSKVSTPQDHGKLGGAARRSSWPGVSPTPAFQRSAGPPAELASQNGAVGAAVLVWLLAAALAIGVALTVASMIRAALAGAGL